MQKVGFPVKLLGANRRHWELAAALMSAYYPPRPPMQRKGSMCELAGSPWARATRPFFTVDSKSPNDLGDQLISESTPIR